MAELTVRSLYSRYMLWVPDLENHLELNSLEVQGMSPGIITKPDSEVLDLQRLLLADLLNRDNLASGLLELPQLPQEVPEPGLSHNLVRGEDPHPANTRIDEACSNQAKDR